MTTLREGITEIADERIDLEAAMKPAELRRWRNGQDLTQKQASEWVGCSRRTWIRWELGERTIPRWLRIIVVAVPASSALRRLNYLRRLN